MLWHQTGRIQMAVSSRFKAHYMSMGVPQRFRFWASLFYLMHGKNASQKCNFHFYTDDCFSCNWPLLMRPLQTYSLILIKENLVLNFIQTVVLKPSKIIPDTCPIKTICGNKTHSFLLKDLRTLAGF